MKLLIRISILLCSGCTLAKNTPITDSSCSMESARATATKAFTRQKQPSELTLTSSETDSSYVFDFDLADRYTKGIVGGGGKIIVFKRSCVQTMYFLPIIVIIQCPYLTLPEFFFLLLCFFSF